MPDSDELLTRREVQRLLGVGRIEMERYIRDEVLPGRMYDGTKGRVAWRRADIVAWVADGCPKRKA